MIPTCGYMHYHFLNFYNFWWSNSSCFFCCRAYHEFWSQAFMLLHLKNVKVTGFYEMILFAVQVVYIGLSLHVCSSEKLSVLFITLFRYRTFSLVPSFLTSAPEFWEHMKVFLTLHLKMFPKRFQYLLLRTLENVMQFHLKCSKKEFQELLLRIFENFLSL